MKTRCSWPEPLLVLPLDVAFSNFEQAFTYCARKSFQSSKVHQRQLIRCFTEQLASKNSQTPGESTHKRTLLLNFSRASKLTNLFFRRQVYFLKNFLKQLWVAASRPCIHGVSCYYCTLNSHTRVDKSESVVIATGSLK